MGIIEERWTRTEWFGQARFGMSIFLDSGKTWRAVMRLLYDQRLPDIRRCEMRRIDVLLDKVMSKT